MPLSRLVIILLCTVLLPSQARGEALELEPHGDRPGWTAWHRVLGFNHQAVAFLADRRHGWAVGQDGAILATADGGATWTVQASGTTRDLAGIHVAEDGRQGWAVGRGGTILATADGGATWSAQTSGTDHHLTSIHVAADGRHGWAVGDRGTILATGDGGATWTAQASGTNQRLTGIHIAAEGRRGWAVGTGGTILVTADGGATWTAQDSGTGRGLYGLHVARDGRHGWAVGHGGTILVTADGGATWSARASGTDKSLTGIHVTAEGRHGWAVGEGGTILATADGGATWSAQASGTGRLLFDIHVAAGGRHGWALGERDTILATEDGGATWSARAGGTEYLLFGIHVARDGRQGWAVGKGGTILATADGGATWTAQASGTTGDLTGIHVTADGRHGWAVGEGGTIVATADGGATWSAQDSGTDYGLAGIHVAADGRHGWAVGKGGTILATSDGGATWSARDSGTNYGLAGIHVAADGRHGWAVGAGTILATADGGATWSARDSGTDYGLAGIHVAEDGRHGWAVSKREILATEDGGATWSARASGTNFDLIGIRFANDRRHGWAVGYGGTILATADGGATWAAQTSGTSRILNGLHVAEDGRQVWAVGERGTVLVGTRQNSAPFLTSFDAATGVDGTVVLAFDVGDAEGDKISIAGFEVCSLEKTTPRCEAIPADKLARNQDGVFELAWHPGSTQHYAINPGDRVRFQATLADGRFPFLHATKAWTYLPWHTRVWNEHRNTIVGGATLAGAFGSYFGLLFALLLFRPVVLTRIGGDKLLEATEAVIPGAAATRPIRSLVSALVMPYFVQHPRARKAWVRGYAGDRERFAELAPKVRVRYLASPEVLDAWVDKRAARAEAAFARKDSVRQRRLYIPLPVAIDDPGAEPVPAAPKVFRALFQHERAAVAICGPGGSGKSTLAVQIARWAAGEDAQDWLLEHRMIPVWIDAETTDLFAAVTSELREMTGTEDTDAEIVAALLRHKRLLVVVDALSERTRETQEHVCAIYGTETPINALLVTSRTEPDVGSRSTVLPRLIDEGTVIPFIQRYLETLDLADRVRKTLRGRQQLQISERALAIVERRGEKVPVTPLFIRMFVDGVVEQIERERGFDPEKLATSVPQTVLDYLERINPQGPDTPDRLDNLHMLRAARALGRAELEPNFVPKDLRGAGAETALAEAKIGDGALALRRLIANGVVEARTPGGTTLYRFALDPIAEYLAAIDWTDRNGADDQAWRSFLERLDRENGVTVRGFTVALFDAVSTYAEDFGVPSWVIHRLEDLTGEDRAAA